MKRYIIIGDIKISLEKMDYLPKLKGSFSSKEKKIIAREIVNLEEILCHQNK